MFDDEVEQAEKVNFDKALEVANRVCENDQVLNDKECTDFEVYIPEGGEPEARQSPFVSVLRHVLAQPLEIQ